MSEEIVKRLRSRSLKELNALRESLPLHGISEEDELDDNIPEESESSSEEEVDIDTTPLKKKKSSRDIPDAEAEEGETEDSSEEDSKEKESSDSIDIDSNNTKGYVNPLDNNYAVNYKIGDRVLVSYSNGTNSTLTGDIDGYDKEGFYRIKWSNGLTTDGITDISLSKLSNTTESKCICGGTKFLNEGRFLLCDVCGRIIKESASLLPVDTNSKKKKNIIRAEMHPISTAVKPTISESSVEDDDDESDDIFSTVRRELAGEFWSRMNELIEDIEDLGYTVLDDTSEYVVLSHDNDEDDQELYVPIVGTSRTMKLDFSNSRLL